MTEDKGSEAKSGEGQQALGIAVAGLLGQVGCLTVIIIAAALAAGLWIDAQFDTQPIFTIVCILGSIPVTIYLMIRLVLSGMARFQPDMSPGDQERGTMNTEEA
ncbi:MAG: AtpZ/AtpI family protein [Anaerolineales bacterium]